MKRVSTVQLAFSFVGVFLGAGFVSGQELWQFFACFGPLGFFGFLLSAGLCLLVVHSLLLLARKTGCGDVSTLMLPGDMPWLRNLVSFLQCLLLFGIVVIMIAGATTLLQGLTRLPTPVCGVIFCLILLPAALFEQRSIITAFSVLVPITAVIAVVLGVTILFRQEFQLAPAAGSVAVLLPNWWISGITYAAYNLFGALGILVPFAALVREEKTIRRGLGLGAVVFLILTFCILAALMAVPGSGSAELPTAELARQLHPILGSAYDLLMGLGMFSSALASLIALLQQAGFHWPVLQRRRRSFLLLFLVAAYVLSLAGFGNLISIVYPIFGYAGIPFLVMLVLNWFKSKKQPAAHHSEL